jgi:hypothetical protein
VQSVSYYCVPAYGVPYCCVPEHEVSLIVSLNTGRVLLLCPCVRIVSHYCVPWTRSVSCCVPEPRLSLIIVSLNMECVLLMCSENGVSLIVSLNTGRLLLLCPWIRIISYYCVPEHGLSLIIVSLHVECVLLMCSENGVALIVSLNTGRLLLLCPWRRSVSYYCVPGYGVPLIIVSLNTEFLLLLCLWRRQVNLYISCILRDIPWQLLCSATR